MRALLGKKISLFVVIALCSAQSIHAQFIGLESEIHAISEYGTTYRIYAEFGSATDECVAVFSVGAAEDNPVTLELGVTTSFYQNPVGVNLGSGINPIFLEFFPELGYDSWFTIGSETSEDPTISSVGMAGAFNQFNNGEGFVLGEGAVGGSWYINPGSSDLALAGDDGMVLLGQFTATDDADGNPGVVTCDWNIQWRDAEGVSYNELGATHDTADNYVFGCTDEAACNYDATATVDNGMCEYAGEYLDCDGNCLNDADADGICDEFEVTGCTDAFACNYNLDATDDDGSCDFLSCVGCTDAGACNYDPNTQYDDGSCDYSCLGCMDEAACNFDASATGDSGDCIFAMTYYDCSGACINDFDGDGVCNELEIFGCTFPIACNYDYEATEDDGSCIFYCPGCVDQSACNFDPNAIQDDGSCTYPLDIFGVEFLDCNGNCLNDNDGDGVCDEEEIQGCMDSNACDYNEAATDQLLPCIYPDAGYNCEGFCLFDFDEDGICDEFDSCPEDPENDLDGDGVCSNDEIEGCTNEQACNFIPTATEEDGSCLLVETICGDDHFTCDCTCISDIDGDEICDEDEIPGCQEMSACNFNPDATDSDGSCEWSTCAGCIYSFACNYDPNALYSDGSCEFGTCPGCTNPLACNFNPTVSADDGSCYFAEEAYDCQGNCLNDADNDGLCDEFENGCTDQFACNYIANADNDDGSCEYSSCAGCTDESACNYDAEATSDDGSCTYTETYYDCYGNCLNDVDGDGTCDEFEVLGCTDETACNYSSNATDDDGTCEYESCAGCTNPIACNYDMDATSEDGSCFYAVDGYDCDGVCLTDTDGDGVCDEFEIVGCQDTSACNYDAEATDDDGMCEYAEEYYDCEGNCLMDMDGDGVCDELEVAGCTNEMACNYDAEATDDEGMCEYAEEYYDCEGNCLMDMDGDGVCDEFEVLGCTDETACNYSSNATDDDGTCLQNDECGVCGGDGIADGTCDCYGTLPVEGYDCGGNCLNDADGDGVCDELEVAGCTDEMACNYNLDATDDDGSCDYSCLGCMDETACNYDASATSNDGSCTYAETYYDCDGNCLMDMDNDGVCDELEVDGCLDEAACNYNIYATNDDDSCDYCFCGEGTYWDDLAQACLVIETCEEDLDGDGVIGVEDLLQLLSSFGMECALEPETSEFTCGDPLNYHGYDYATVQIGEQCWFAENLRNTAYSNGDELPTNLDSDEWDSSIYGAYTIYQDDISNLEQFGLLYNFHAGIDDRGLCPTGWHVPTDGEFKVAEISLGMTEAEANDDGWRGSQGLSMKSSVADTPPWDGSNSSGFSALPGGATYYFGGFQPEDPAAVHPMYTQGAYWTSTYVGADNAIYRGFYSSNDGVYRSGTANGYNYDSGMSVRCLKDAE